MSGFSAEASPSRHRTSMLTLDSESRACQAARVDAAGSRRRLPSRSHPEHEEGNLNLIWCNLMGWIHLQELRSRALRRI